MNNFKWLKLVKDGNNYEYVERISGTTGSVIIVAYKIINGEKHYQLIISKRPTFEKRILEFPAGLVEGDECVKEAAIRELKEETGNSGNVVKVLPYSPGAAGISTEYLIFVVVEIDETSEEWIDFGNEKIEILPLMNISTMQTFIESCADEILVSNRVQAFLLGFEMN